MITVIDGRTGKEKNGCTTIGALTGAIALENAWPFDKAHRAAVEKKIFSSNDRRFVFHKAEAIKASGYSVMSQYKEACALLRAGKAAYIEDRTSRVRAGRPPGA